VSSAVVEILPSPGDGGEAPRSLGTWLVSDALAAPQGFECDGRRWTIQLRPRRYYLPYSITLRKFTHERYPGTEIPKNFSSDVILNDPDEGEPRKVLIYMNHPLRHAGQTFYQSGLDANGTISILQVVSNPSVLAPYVACVIVGLGLLVQFSFHLVRFARRQGRRQAS